MLYAGVTSAKPTVSQDERLGTADLTAVSRMSAERVIKEIVTSTPIAQTDDELLSEESGDQLYDERLSKLVREVSRSWPVNTLSDDFCTLSDMVSFTVVVKC